MEEFDSALEGMAAGVGGVAASASATGGGGDSCDRLLRADHKDNDKDRNQNNWATVGLLQRKYTHPT